MWMLHFFSDGAIEYVVNTLVMIGVISCILSFFVINKLIGLFPPLVAYYKVLQVISVAILLSGVYLKGGYNAEMEWRDKVAEVELKLKDAYIKSEKVNTVIEEKIVNKTVVIQGKTKTLIEFVDRETVKIDSSCPIPKEVFEIHNKASRIISEDGDNKK